MRERIGRLIRKTKCFREKSRDKTCRRINVIISKYNLLRYPTEKILDSGEVEEDIDFIEEFIGHQIVTILQSLEQNLAGHKLDRLGLFYRRNTV